MLRTKFLSLFFVFLALNFYGQENEFKIISKVSNDTLFIKWFPKDISSFQSFLNETTVIQWKEIDKKESIKNIDLTISDTKTIIPLSKRIEEIYQKDSSVIIFAETLFNEGDSLALGINFSNALIQNMMDRRIAELTGNTLIIPHFNKNKNYAIQLTNKNFKTKINIISTSKEEFNKIENVNVQISKKSVLYKWNVKDLNNTFCSYNLYKRNEKVKNYNKLNELPIIPFASTEQIDKNQIEYLDKDVKQGETYFYQLKAVDFFGDEIGYSEIKKIYIPLKTNASIEIDTMYAKGGSRYINGMISSIDSTSTINIDEIIVLRSDSMFFGYKILDRIKPIKNNNKFNIELKNYTSGERYYYKLIAISPDKDSIESYSYYFFTFDSIPPGKALDLTGKIDSLGIMKLTWNAPKDTDILGYRVFKANTKKEQFYEITPNLLIKTDVTDTLPLDNLTNEICYYVRVVDENFNNSIPSDTIVLEKPDTIAPVSGVIYDFKKTEKDIKIFWHNSTSTDIFIQYLIREHNGIKNKIFSWSDTSTFTFSDTNVTSGEKYNYTLFSEDKYKNQDSSSTITIEFELGYREAIKNLAGKVDNQNKMIILSWSPPKNNNVYTYQIYRSKEGENFKLLKTLSEPEKTTYEDKNITLNNKYFYKINATLKTGIPTKISEPILVVY